MRVGIRVIDRRERGVSTRSAVIGLLALPVVALGLSACGSAPSNDTFDLSAAVVDKGPAARGRQLLIPTPTALKALDSEQVVVRVSSSEVQYLAKSQWSDKLPRMVQAKLVEAFENTGRLGGVGVPGQGLAIDYQLVSDVRTFEVDTNGADRGQVEISVKLVNDRNGTVKAQQVFTAEVAASGTSNDAYITALDRAFAKVTAEIVTWTFGVL